MTNTTNTQPTVRKPVITIFQILLAVCCFLFTSLIGQALFGRFFYFLYQNKMISEQIFENYFLTGLLPETLLNFLASTLIILFYKRITHKSVSEMGLTPKSTKWILLGMLTFFVLLGVITVVLLLTGDIAYMGVQFHSSIFQYFLLMISVSFVEEVLNRGFIQHLVKERTNTFWSILIPSIIFMMFHLQNPGITWLSLVNIFLAGICFSLITQVTGSIWFAFGAHIIWNVGGACIFGLMDVSATTGSILNFAYTRDTLFNGYGKTPLSGLIGTVVWVLLITFFYYRLHRKSETA